MAYHITLPDNYKEGDKIVFSDQDRTATIYDCMGEPTVTLLTNE